MTRSSTLSMILSVLLANLSQFTLMYPCSFAICNRMMEPPTAIATAFPIFTVTKPVNLEGKWSYSKYSDRSKDLNYHPDAAPTTICWVADFLVMSPKNFCSAFSASLLLGELIVDCGGGYATIRICVEWMNKVGNQKTCCQNLFQYQWPTAIPFVIDCV